MKVTIELTRAEAKRVMAFLELEADSTVGTTEVIPEHTEAPKKTTTRKPRTKKEVEPEVTPEQKEPEPKKAPRPEDIVGFTLDEIKREAKAAIGRTDRETVKKTISRYGQKLVEVTVNNYTALMNELKGL